MDRVERVMENKEGKQQEEKKEKRSGSQRKKLKNTLKCRWCTCEKNYTFSSFELRVTLSNIENIFTIYFCLGCLW